MTLPQICFTAGVVLGLLACFFGMRFYPPGYGYDEEKRNNRIATGLFVLAGICFVLSGFFAR